MKRSRLTKREQKAWNARRRAQHPEPTPAEVEAMANWAVDQFCIGLTREITLDEARAMFPAADDET